jgi:hypothetical protein
LAQAEEEGVPLADQTAEKQQPVLGQPSSETATAQAPELRPQSPSAQAPTQRQAPQAQSEREGADAAASGAGPDGGV